MNYTHLTLEERYQIRDAAHRGDGARRIGKVMDRHRSTIERELKRHVGPARYEARSAHALSVARSSASNARPRLTEADWEADTMRFAKGRAVVFTAIERKTLYAVMAKSINGTARAVTKALLSVLAPLAPRVHTLTLDNGSEFAENGLVDIALDAKTYFADPYSPQQRGCNENWNGLVRQYLPRGASLSHVSDDEISRIQEKLNNRPRKKLGFRTPKEMLLRSLNRGALRS